MKTEGAVIRLLAAVLVRRGGMATDVNIVRKILSLICSILALLLIAVFVFAFFIKLIPSTSPLFCSNINFIWLREVVHQAGMGSTVVTIVGV